MNTETENLPEKTLELMASAERDYSRATTLVVTTQPEYEAAGVFIAMLKDYARNLEKDRKSIVDPINQSVKKINARYKPKSDAIDTAIEQVNAKMVAYYRAEEKKRLQAEAEAAEAARKEKERLEARAAKAEASGKVEKAAVLAQAAEMINTNPIAPVTEKQTAQTTMVTTYSARVYDLLSLVEAVAAGKAPLAYIEANMSALNSAARSQKETLNVPGVKAVSETNVRSK